MKFAIKGWKAWKPGCSTQSDWESWGQSLAVPADNASKNSASEHNAVAPDVSMVPAMLRRRLSPQAKAVFSVALPLLGEYGNMPIVHASRHGEVERTFSILKDIAAGEMVSPMQFSLAVHNAISGMLSIQQNVTDNITAIAACGEELVPALLEAIGLLENHSHILCVFNDAPIPSELQFVGQYYEPYSVACVISTGEGCELLTEEVCGNQADVALPQPLALVQLLAGGCDSISLPLRGRSWLLKRCE